MKTVAVEQGLASVKQYLASQGCDVIDVQTSESNATGASCMVVTGGDKNLMGIQSVTQQIPIISAEGLSPEDVYDRVQSHLS